MCSRQRHGTLGPAIFNVIIFVLFLKNSKGCLTNVAVSPLNGSTESVHQYDCNRNFNDEVNFANVMRMTIYSVCSDDFAVKTVTEKERENWKNCRFFWNQ